MMGTGETDGHHRMTKQSAQSGSGAMFDRIAKRYDVLNRLMSFGLDDSWRKRTIAAMQLGPGARVLDLATGTGDVAIRIARSHPDARVLGVDPSHGMLDIGRSKLAKLGLEERVELTAGDACHLPQPDDSFDGVCIAFGIRNVPDRPAALSEMARVTRPGGRIVILELAEPRRGWLAPLARFHMRVLVPRLGALLSGAREYRYLQQSIAAFPPAEEFARVMQGAGIRVLSVEALTFGVCHVYVGTPLEREPTGRPQGDVA